MGTTILAWLITILGPLMIAGGDLGPRRFVESKKADGNSTETLGYGDCNDLRRVFARYCPGLTPVAHSGSSGCGGSLELRRYRPL